MATTVTPTVEFTLALTAEERQELLGLLEHALGETRVEAHRTHTPAYREQVLREETVLRGLLQKLRADRA